MNLGCEDILRKQGLSIKMLYGRKPGACWSISIQLSPYLRSSVTLGETTITNQFYQRLIIANKSLVHTTIWCFWWAAIFRKFQYKPQRRSGSIFAIPKTLPLLEEENQGLFSNRSYISNNHSTRCFRNQTQLHNTERASFTS